MSDERERDRGRTLVEAEGAYCRAVEAHLCRRNHGHVMRLVGPSFECVRSWAVRGVPLKIAIQGIDRYVDRAEAKGPRRRPMRVEFCEADVLDVFDEWRRALGLPLSLLAQAGDEGRLEEGDAGEEERGHRSLPKHVERVLASLNGIPGRSGVPAGLAEHVAVAIEELATLAERCRGGRRTERQAVASRLAEMESALMAVARAVVEPEVRAALAEEARTEIEPFRARMPLEAYARAHAAATDRLIRRYFHLPTLAFA
jgi:hypothetical protein